MKPIQLNVVKNLSTWMMFNDEKVTQANANGFKAIFLKWIISVFSVVSSPENALVKLGKKKKKRELHQFSKYFQFNNLNTFVQIQNLQEKNLKDYGRAVKCIIKI
ncbi:hypothetical protein RFI_25389 [Reticulomyxa filosa]|uniref:Uncharacterized protein n=1 Tax=Reticulomyxa filosa TaxID=46433 RepID=X6MF03_RETFI|nr:hypothetical protein RFI_25389 [Reticulomyxa filosa]|eukprot:ETO11987.1 hypothetical protein RFI_25389 [Reticulomyxa filosa]